MRTIRWSPVLAGLVLLANAAAPAAAQLTAYPEFGLPSSAAPSFPASPWLGDGLDAPPDSIQQLPRPRTGLAGGVIGGSLGSAAGTILGAALGYTMRSCDAGEWLCGVGEMFAFGLTGSILGSAGGARAGVALSGAEARSFGRSAGGAALGFLVGGAAAVALSAATASEGAAMVGFVVGQGALAALFTTDRR